MIAGINAHMKAKGKESFILSRNEAYIGVLIDDLITKGVDEPYRMFTSRSEYRILLRQDNADYRLTARSHEIGLADESRYTYTMRKYESVDYVRGYASVAKVKPYSVNEYLESVASKPLSETKTLVDLISRPEVSYKEILKFVPRGTGKTSFDDTVLESEMVPELLKQSYRDEILDNAEIAIKYKGYIDREELIAEKISRLEYIRIPDNFDFSKINGLTIECRQKLQKYKPETIGQASRISGVSPSDISVLLVWFKR